MSDQPSTASPLVVDRLVIGHLRTTYGLFNDFDARLLAMIDVELQPVAARLLTHEQTQQIIDEIGCDAEVIAATRDALHAAVRVWQSPSDVTDQDQFEQWIRAACLPGDYPVIRLVCEGHSNQEISEMTGRNVEEIKEIVRHYLRYKDNLPMSLPPNYPDV